MGLKFKTNENGNYLMRMIIFIALTLTSISGAEYCFMRSACLHVFLHASSHISKTTCPKFTNFVHVSSDHIALYILYFRLCGCSHVCTWPGDGNEALRPAPGVDRYFINHNKKTIIAN